MTQIMLVGEQDLWLSGLVQIMSHQRKLNVVGQGGYESIGARMSRGERPQVLIIDLTHAFGRGLGMVERVRRTCPRVNIIGLVLATNQPALRRLIELGVRGLITPDTQESEFMELVLRVARQEYALTGSLAQALATCQLPGQASDFSSLTTREMEVALSLLEGKRMPLIARELKVSPKTVATYKYRIYEKLDVDTEVALLKLAIRSGLVDLNQIDSQPGLFEALV